MKLITTIYATENYCYALPQQAARAAACFCDARMDGGEVIIVTDESEKALRGVDAYKCALPEGFRVHHIALKNVSDTGKPYQEEAQLLIARLQHAAWTAARRFRPDYVWSLESDVMPPRNALTCMIQMLQFDHNYYDVAMVTYPNRQFLGGRSTPGHWIAPDVYEDERNIPEDLQGELRARQEKLESLAKDGKEPTPEEVAVWRELDEKVKASPQKGNIFSLQSTRWRRRGWLEAAYPGIGKGAVLPSDWVGLGCTLMSAKAINAAHYEGYEGKGTQDLWLAHRCWQDLKLCVIPHVVAHHIKREKGEDKLSVYFARHEDQGEQIGHLRSDTLSWKDIA